MDTVRRRLVDVILKYACIRHRNGCHDEPSCHPEDWAEVDLVLAEQGVDYDFALWSAYGHLNAWNLLLE